MFINVVGGKDYDNEIKKQIYNFGIRIGKINNFKTQELEKYLLENMPQLSLVSVQVKGNSIIVNAYENFELGS